MTASADWSVGPVGSPPEPGEAAAEPQPESSAIAGEQLPDGWSEADVKALVKVLRGPYEKLAATTGDDTYKLTELEEIVLVGSLTSWMPASWVRAGQHGSLPLIVALPLTVGVLVAVNAPKLAHWNRTHPDARIDVPFIGRKGGRRGPGHRPQPAPREDEGRGDDAGRPGGADDRDAGPAAPAAGVEGPGPSDGGPPADSLDDIRRSYAAQ